MGKFGQKRVVKDPELIFNAIGCGAKQGNRRPDKKQEENHHVKAILRKRVHINNGCIAAFFECLCDKQSKICG